MEVDNSKKRKVFKDFTFKIYCCLNCRKKIMFIKLWV